MAKTVVYRSFEVREGFGPDDGGHLRFESESRGDADRVLEQLWGQGWSVQLFGIKAHAGEGDQRVLLRSLVGQQAA